MTADYNVWFKVSGTDVRWLEKSPANRVSRCDRGWNHVVQPEEPRLVVDNGAGPSRKKGKGKRNEYLCRTCAERYYQTRPPSMLQKNQGELFNL